MASTTDQTYQKSLQESTRAFREEEFISTKAISPTQKKIFISFAVKDDEYVTQLIETIETYLKIIDSVIKVEFWKYNQQVLAGEKFNDEIDKAIKECEYGLLMLSENFLASDFIQANELPYYTESSSKDVSKKAIPLFIRKVDYSYAAMDKIKEQTIILSRGKDYVSCKDEEKNSFAEEVANQIVKIIKKSTSEHQQQTREFLSHLIKNKDSEELTTLTKEFIPTRSALLKSSAITDDELKKEGNIDVVSYVKNWAKTKPQSSKFFALLGDSGMGKTWSCMKVALELLDGYKKETIDFRTIYLDLRH